MLYQMKHSGLGYDHYGITKIKYQRRTPQNVVVPLDDPAASSFIRLGQGSAISSPNKRKKKVEDIKLLDGLCTLRLSTPLGFNSI